MSKKEIDIEMIRRFEKAALRCDPTGAWVCANTRAGLEAALNPPEHISLSGAVIAAIVTESHEWNIQHLVTLRQLTDIYKAAERARRAELLDKQCEIKPREFMCVDGMCETWCGKFYGCGPMRRSSDHAKVNIKATE